MREDRKRTSEDHSKILCVHEVHVRSLAHSGKENAISIQTGQRSFSAPYLCKWSIIARVVYQYSVGSSCTTSVNAFSFRLSSFIVAAYRNLSLRSYVNSGVGRDRK